MALYTSSEAVKLLNKLKVEENRIVLDESYSSVFKAATCENKDDVRPHYMIFETYDELNQIRRKIRIVKHAINVFNTTTEVEDGITIDEVLVLLPQLRERAELYKSMASKPPFVRTRSYGSGQNSTIDYEYTNYEIEDAQKLYEETYERMSSLQLALDKVNSTVKFEIAV